ncbi:MAG: acyltransferase family protein [Pseudoramibacter sp.]
MKQQRGFMERVKWIDNARAIGILFIITGHTIGLTFGQTFFNVIYAVNVAIFFFLSGYLHRQKPIKKVIKGGVENLLLPYVITSVLMITFSMITLKKSLIIFCSLFCDISSRADCSVLWCGDKCGHFWKDAGEHCGNWRDLVSAVYVCGEPFVYRLKKFNGAISFFGSGLYGAFCRFLRTWLCINRIICTCLGPFRQL